MSVLSKSIELSIAAGVVVITAAALTDASVQRANALDTPISQSQILLQQLANSPVATPLLNGIGGPEPAIGVLDSDAFAHEIGSLALNMELGNAYESAHDFNERDDGEDPLAQILENTPSDQFKLGRIIAAEPIENARISSPFGYRTLGRREFHAGIDFAAPTGSPILATGKGIVSYSGWMSGYGRLVEIDHGHGLKTRYGHMSEIFVSKGDTVKRGKKIAAVGCTGRCTGPHLHYEVRFDGRTVNPATYIAMAKRDS